MAFPIFPRIRNQDSDVIIVLVKTLAQVYNITQEQKIMALSDYICRGINTNNRIRRNNLSKM